MQYSSMQHSYMHVQWHAVEFHAVQCRAACSAVEWPVDILPGQAAPTLPANSNGGTTQSGFGRQESHVSFMTNPVLSS